VVSLIAFPEQRHAGDEKASLNGDVLSTKRAMINEEPLNDSLSDELYRIGRNT
jgi:hypothetical protein